MSDKAWKQEERRVAELFGLRRRPLSGNSRAGLGAGDVMNADGSRPNIVVEVKSWKRMPLVKHLNKLRAEAQREGHPWVLAIHAKNSKERFAVCELAYFAFLFEKARKSPDASELEPLPRRRWNSEGELL